MKKRLQVLVSLFSVIVTAFTMTSLTLAWINTNEYVDRITVKTGEGKFEMHTGIFNRLVDGPDTSVDVEPNHHPTIDEQNSTNEAIAFNFSHSISPVKLADMVLDEHSLNAAALPSYVFELHAHTTLEASYIRISLNQQPYSGAPNVDFSLYNFQYLAVDNDPNDEMEYAAPIKLGDLEAKERHDFNGTTPIFLTDGATGAFNSYELVVAPQDINFYNEYFAKSILILIRPNPVEFYKFLIAEQLKGTQTKKVGITFQLYVEFSLVPFPS